MHTEGEKLDPSVLAEMGYEKRDLNYHAILVVGAYFIGFTLFGVFLSWVFFQVPGVRPNYGAGRPMTVQAAPAGTPILQTNSNNTEDISTLRQKEQKILESSGQLADGFYHIPVDQAMNTVLQQKQTLLPSSADAPAVPASATQTPQSAPSGMSVPAGGHLVPQATSTAPKPTVGGKP